MGWDRVNNLAESMRILSWALSDVGRKRDHNEDCFLVDQELALYAVADGMGGHQGGGRASKMAVDILERELRDAGDLEVAGQKLRDAEQQRLLRSTVEIPRPSQDPGLAPTLAPSKSERRCPPGETYPCAALVLRAAMRGAGRAIFDAAEADIRYSGMGTTLTSLLFHGGMVHIAHVGDSRAFRIHEGEIEQLTVDHSWIAEQLRAGMMSEAEARESRFRHVITRSVGFEREVDIDLLGIPMVPGDCFILCSDGMSNYIETEELGKIVGASYYSRIPQLLVDIANDRGGDDNITIVVVYLANDRQTDSK